jgi:predicted Zn-dependent protease
MTHRAARLSALTGLLLFAACATIDSTPDAPSIGQSDRAQATQAHPQILQQLGGAVEGPAGAYVANIGERVATAAGVPGQCTFTLVNSDVPNAFAIPGCYIYVTRGILALMNSEDELASVLGHEVGHVVADHAAQRQNTATLSGLGAVLAGILTGSGEIAQAASQAAQLLTLNYSRDQEFEADDLGVRYLQRSGYNAHASADLLRSLGMQETLSARVANRDAASATPGWARTHPLSAERVARATAQASGAGATRENPPERIGPHLAAVDGMIFGDDPEQGFVNGRTFSHPTLRIAFEAPAGFTLTNTPSAVLIAGPNNARAQFGAGALQGDLAAYASNGLRQVIANAPAQLGQVQRGTTNGLETATAPARAQTQSGQAVDVAVTAYRVGDRAYHFITLAPAGGGSAFTSMLGSMRTLSAREAAALRARVIDVIQVRSGDTAQSLANRMAFDDYRLERFLVLNGREAGASLRAGEQVKVVMYAR